MIAMTICATGDDHPVITRQTPTGNLQIWPMGMGGGVLSMSVPEWKLLVDRVERFLA